MKKTLESRFGLFLTGFVQVITSYDSESDFKYNINTAGDRFFGGP